MKNLISWGDFKVNESKQEDHRAEIRNRGKVIFSSEDKKVNDNKDHFPINSLTQARNAIARVNQYSTVPKWFDGTLKQVIDKVYKEVHKNYPSIKIDEDKKG